MPPDLWLWRYRFNSIRSDGMITQSLRRPRESAREEIGCCWNDSCKTRVRPSTGPGGGDFLRGPAIDGRPDAPHPEPVEGRNAVDPAPPTNSHARKAGI